MATAAVKKAQASQAAVARRASVIAKQKVAEATKELREKFKRAAPQLRKDVMESFVLPGLSGVVGAVGADMVMDRFKPLAGAKGDIAKILAGVTVGTLGRKLVKTPYLHCAALGITVVNGYKLATRLINRASTGQGLSGLLDDGDNRDLIGTGAQNPGSRLEEVNIYLRDGSQTRGYQDTAGNLYDANGAFISSGNAPALNALPSDYTDPALQAAQQLSGMDEGQRALAAARSLG